MKLRLRAEAVRVTITEKYSEVIEFIGCQQSYVVVS